MLRVTKARRPNRPSIPSTTAQEQQVANIVQTVITDLQPAAGSRIVREALDARNLQLVVDSFPWQDAENTLNLTQEVFENSIVQSLNKAPLVPSKILTGMRFDVTDPRVGEWARAQSAQLVTAITEETRDIIREVVAEAFTKNITVYDTAKRLRNVVGLNTRQFDSYMKFTENLGNMLREQGLSGRAYQERFDKLSRAQYDKMIKYRSEMIARTEIIRAENNGQYLGWQQAVEQGFADPNSMKRWSTSTDERTCDICMPMNGKSVKWDEPYPNGIFQPPAHPNCRCGVSLLEPDSSLAQDFMTADTPQVNPLEIILPEVPKLIPTVPNLLSIDDAVASANSSPLKQSAFQYDAGDIENFNVKVQPVVFNGIPATELRFKLNKEAKEALEKKIAREGEKSSWDTGVVVVIDKKTDGKMNFAPVPKASSDEIYNAINDKVNYQVVSDPLDYQSDKTFTKFLPDGTAIRVVTSKDSTYAYDGMVRVVVPGKPLGTQVTNAMRELGIAANRVPTADDIEVFKVNRIIAVLDPKSKTTKTTNKLVTFEQRKRHAEDLLKQFGASYDDVTTRTDVLGNFQVLMPEKVGEAIAEQTNRRALVHGLGSGVKSPKDVVDLVESGHLFSTTERWTRGTNVRGASSNKDLQTGGADYVFLRPVEREGLETWMMSIEFDAKQVYRRTDWFAYGNDSYGVTNPLQRYYYTGLSSFDEPDNLKELTDGRGGAEIMFQHSFSLDSVNKIYLPSQWVDDVISMLEKRGVTSLGGKPLREVIVAS